jgi:methionine synthase II (cobalamin-independent)
MLNQTKELSKKIKELAKDISEIDNHKIIENLDGLNLEARKAGYSLGTAKGVIDVLGGKRVISPDYAKFVSDLVEIVRVKSGSPNPDSGLTTLNHDIKQLSSEFSNIAKIVRNYK